MGITALLGLAGFCALLVLFGGMPLLLEKSYAVTVELPEAGGLTADNAVRLSGISIGRVADVSFNPPPGRGVIATLKIDADRRIPREARISVHQPLLTGSPALLFNVQQLGAEQMNDTLPIDGSARVAADKSALSPPFQRPLDAMREQFKKPVEQFARMEKRFNDLSDTWTAVGRNIQDLTAGRTADQVDRGEAAANLNSVLDRADKRVAEMKQLLESARQGIARLEQSADKLDTTVDNVGQAATNIAGSTRQAGQDFEKLTRRYIATADDLSALIADTRKLVTSATDGAGSLGKLISDPALYDNLDDSAQRIGKAMDEIRLMIQKWNAEGVPIQF